MSMSVCKTLLFRTACRCTLHTAPSISSFLPCSHSRPGVFRLVPSFAIGPSRWYASSSIQAAASIEDTDEPLSRDSVTEPQEDQSKDTVEHLLTNPTDVTGLMKMERKHSNNNNTLLSQAGDEHDGPVSGWFPYLDRFRYGDVCLTSREVLEALSPHIMDLRKQRLMNVVNYRSYSVCLVVEGLSDFGNVSAAFRSADALGIQSVHVVSCDSSKRYRENRHVSMGAEKWLDIELWDSVDECFEVLKSRGYRIATTHVGMDAVSVYDMNWSQPTAIVVGNENRGISKEALELSDLHCSIPMKGMVDSFNVSVAAGILMHQAVCDRTSRMGCHGDLTSDERQILLAEFSLRHSKCAVDIVQEYAKRRAGIGLARL